MTIINGTILLESFETRNMNNKNSTVIQEAPWSTKFICHTDKDTENLQSGISWSVGLHPRSGAVRYGALLSRI